MSPLGDQSRRSPVNEPDEDFEPDERLGLPKIDKARVLAALFEDPAQGSASREDKAFGRFEVVGRLGRGGMGTVYEGYDPTLDRTVAIKVLHEEADGGHQQRLLREAQALARLSHVNVVQVFETGVVAGRSFIAMELVRGHTLRQWSQQPHPWRECLEVYVQAGRGLAAAHAVDVIHRDFKPANCMIDDHGRVKVFDFGLARQDDSSGIEEPPLPESHRSGDQVEGTDRAERLGGLLEQALTQTGTVLGTPAYMAPEQAQRIEADARADQFSFCVALHEALFGMRPPVVGGLDRVEPASTHASMPTVPAWLRRVLSRGLQPERGDRFPSMNALLDTIEGHVRARRRRLGAMVVGVSLVAVVGSTRALSSIDDGPRCERDPTELAGVWDDAQQVMVSEAFGRSTLAFAEVTHQAIDARLSEWADRWLETRQGACEATHVRGIASDERLDRRIDCLDRQRHEVSAVIHVLASADAATIAHGSRIVAQVPDPRQCERPPQADEGGRLPQDATAREAVLGGYERIARGRARLAAGDLEEASTLGDTVQTLARAHAYLPLELEVDILRGQIAAESSLYDEAADHLFEAIHRAAREGLNGVELDARGRAVDILVGRWSKPEVERMMVDELEVMLPREGEPPSRWGPVASMARAHLAAVAGDHEGALELLGRARRARAEDEPSAVAGLLQDEAAALAELGRADEARVALEDARQRAQQAWGDGAPAVADIEQDLGMLAFEAGDLERAHRELERAQAHFEAATGEDGVRVARVRFCRAKLAMATGEFDRARAELEAVGRIFERDLGSQHEETGQLYNALGVSRFYLDDHLGAIDAYERALVVGLAVYGAAHPEVALLYSNIAESRAAVGDHAAALEGYAKALAIMQTMLPAEHPTLATPYKGRGQSLLALGRSAEALEALERALDLIERTGAEPFELADTRLALAQALQIEGEHSDRARTLAQLARQGFSELGFPERAARARALLEQIDEHATPDDTNGVERP